MKDLVIYDYTKTLGYWSASWRDEDGKRKQKTSSKIKTKEEFRSFILSTYGSEGNVLAGTIAHLAPKWLELKEKRGMDLATLKQFKSNCKVWLMDSDEEHLSIQNVNLKELTPKVLREWIHSIDRAAYTKRNILFSLRAFIDDCIAEEWVDLEYNPCNEKSVKKELPKGKTIVKKDIGDDEKIVFNVEQTNQLLECKLIGEFNYIHYLLGLFTGMRAAEIGGLQWGDLIVDEGVDCIWIKRQLARYESWKGGMKTKLPKKDRRRKVPMLPELKEWLDAWKTIWEKKYGRKAKETDWMLPNPNVEQPEAFVARLAEMLRDDLEAAGLSTKYEGEYPYTFHALRRTMMTSLENAGVGQNIVKRLVGHSAEGVTSGSYSKLGSKFLLEALEKLPFKSRSVPETAVSKK